MGEDETRPIIRRALDLGINFFDTADMYSLGVSEEVVGRILKDFIPRKDVIITSKVFFPMSDDPNDAGLSRKHIKESIDASLTRLGTDYIDLYQIHRWDPATTVDEVLSTLDELISKGKVRYIGASSMFAWQFAKYQYRADLKNWSRFISMQNHYNLIYREDEREMIPYCQEEGIGLLPWSPLARGFLAGNRYRDGKGATKRAKDDTLAAHLYYRDSDFNVLDRLIEVSNERERSPIEVALAWLLNKPYITAPIVGVRSVEQLDQLAGSMDIRLSHEEIEALEKHYRPHPVLGHD
jgi:aryl-alcohol dehydrogenase (NADP+)